MSTAEKNQGLNPHCSAQSMIVGSCYRFSLLTARLVRMEYDPDGVFEDRPTQMAVNRSFPPVEYAVYETLRMRSIFSMTRDLLQCIVCRLRCVANAAEFIVHGIIPSR